MNGVFLNGSRHIVYTGGYFAAKDDGSSSGKTVAYSSNQPLAVAARYYDPVSSPANATNFFKGAIESIAIYDGEFPELEVQVGGQTGLDLAPKGRNKSQILRDFNDEDELHFFGDMMEEGQNDYPLAKAVQERGGYTYHVKDWKETRTKLIELTEFTG